VNRMQFESEAWLRETWVKIDQAEFDPNVTREERMRQWIETLEAWLPHT
jgi:hypothetical protein